MAHTDELSRFQILELRSSLTDELLMFGGKFSMPHRLKAGVPYLDRTEVNYLQRLETGFKMRRRLDAWLRGMEAREPVAPQTVA